jgi:hypothetical protein
MISVNKTGQKPYIVPRVIRVVLQDKQLVAMAVCKYLHTDPACYQQPEGVTPLFEVSNPS